MSNIKRLVLVILAFSAMLQLQAQRRVNLNNWFLAGNVGTTFGHMDVRPNGADYFENPFNHFSYSISPEVSYHFTHGFGVIASYTWANVRSDENNRLGATWRARNYDTDLQEFKFMGHLNLGKALSFNKRRNIVSPYVNLGVGSTSGQLNGDLSFVGSDVARQLLRNDGHDTTSFQTWNKNLQVGFYWYLNRYLDLDIRYNYTFYNEDYIDGHSIATFGNREWDKYSSVNIGVRFKFGVNNKRTYEHTSWAREPLEEDTSLFNNYVEIEEYDDGTGDPVFKIRTRGDNISEENLTKIDSENSESEDDDMYQAIYNTLMDNPDLRDSLLGDLAKEIQNNDYFITRVQDGVCIECPGTEQVIIRKTEDGKVIDTVYRNSKNPPIDGVSGEEKGRDPKKGNITPPVTKIDEFELKDIYYDLDESFIRTDASGSLDELVKVLKKYPNIKVELGSHTDCRNSKKYNLALSQRRALAAVNYIECQGIDRCRLVAKAYGEHDLVNDCECEGDNEAENCSEEEHQRNRRTTVKILDYNYQPGKSGCQSGVAVDKAAEIDARNNSEEISNQIPAVDVTKEQIKKAGVSMQPKAGYYIIIGTSYHPAYAKSLAGVAKNKENFSDADVLYLEDTKYFIYTHSTDDYEKALAKLKEVRCCTRFPDAWIYSYKTEIPE